MSERAACQSLVDSYGGAGVVLCESCLDLRVLTLLEHRVARALSVLPLAILGGELHVASAAPFGPDVLAMLSRSHGHPIVGLLAMAALLPGAIDAAYAAAAAGHTTLIGMHARGAGLQIVRGAHGGLLEWLEPVSASARG